MKGCNKILKNVEIGWRDVTGDWKGVTKGWRDVTSDW